MDKFIMDDAPGICSQDDFDHDYELLMIKARMIGALVKEKGYKIPEKYQGFNLSKE